MAKQLQMQAHPPVGWIRGDVAKQCFGLDDLQWQRVQRWLEVEGVEVCPRKGVPLDDLALAMRSIRHRADLPKLGRIRNTEGRG